MYYVRSYFQADPRSVGEWYYEGTFKNIDDVRVYLEEARKRNPFRDYRVYKQEVAWVPVKM